MKPVLAEILDSPTYAYASTMVVDICRLRAASLASFAEFRETLLFFILSATKISHN
jgi:hypothetical protein